MNASGIVVFARWRSPFPGRTTSRRNHVERPALAPAARQCRLRQVSKLLVLREPRREREQTDHAGDATDDRGRVVHVVLRGLAIGLAGRREVRASIPPEQAGHDRGEARDPDQRGSHTGSRAEPPVQRRGERHGAAAERDEAGRHHVWIVRILRGEAADVLVPELVLVLTTLCDQPGRGERGGSEQPAERPETIAPRHADIVEVRPCGPCGESPTVSCG